MLLSIILFVFKIMFLKITKYMFTAIRCKVLNNCYIWAVRRGWLCARSGGRWYRGAAGGVPILHAASQPGQPAANCNNSITTQSSLMKLSVIVFTAQNCELQTQDTSLPCAVWGLWGACHGYHLSVHIGISEYVWLCTVWILLLWTQGTTNWMLGFK